MTNTMKAVGFYEGLLIDDPKVFENVTVSKPEPLTTIYW